MKVLVIKRDFLSKNDSIDLLTKVLKKYKIQYDIVEFKDIEDFYAKIKAKKIKTKYDIMITYGGDGTILHSAKIALKYKIPILGINAGTLGFLTSISSPNEMDGYFKRVISGDYDYIERSMLNIKVVNDGKKKFETYAVNEAIITTKGEKKLHKYLVGLDEDNNVSNEYRADGIIISTPTGSTAYSFSAGGPMCFPDAKCLLITAICPFSFNQRSIVVSDDKEIIVKVKSEKGVVNADGRIEYDLQKNDVIEITKQTQKLKYITFDKNQFLTNIKNKIKNI